MSSTWTAIIAEGMGFASDLFVDFLPIIGVGVGLSVFAIIYGIFIRKG